VKSVVQNSELFIVSAISSGSFRLPLQVEDLFAGVEGTPF